MEYFDVYDQHRKVLSKKIARGENLEKGEYHLVVDIILINSKNQFLIQKRTSNKSYCPNMWGLTGGSVDAGEDSLTAILRETQEEIGLTLKPEEIELFHQANGEDQPILIDVWIGQTEVCIENLKLQSEEVCAAKWVNFVELREIISQKQFMPTLVPFVEKVMNDLW